jgi:integrase
MALVSLYNYAASQNGNHEVEILSSGSKAPNLLPLTGACAPHSPPTQVAASEPPASAAPVGGKAGVSLDGLVERFRAASHDLALSTRDTHDYLWRMAKPHLDFQRDVCDIKLADLRNLKSRLCSEKYANSTVNDILFKGLGVLFRIAAEDGLMEKSPLERLKRLKLQEPERAQPSWEQSLQIVEAVTRSAPETGLIVGFARHFGVGKAEIRHLKGEHIDLSRKVIHFRRQKTGKLFDVPIFSYAEVFIEALKNQGTLKADHPVVQWRNPRKALESACNAIGMPVYSPIAFRRTFIIHCLEQGIDARVVAMWQGHRDATLIFSKYGKYISQEHARAMAAKLT